MTRSMGIERRASTGEIRAVEDGKERMITGYAAVFDSLSEPIGGFARGAFKEKIARDAFTNCLRSEPNVVCLANHDPQWILGRSPRTLSLRTDNVGLRYTCTLPDTQQGNSIWESVKRQDIRSSSFGFTAEDDSWSDNHVRTLRQVVLHDVSPVTWPAYSQTSCSVRSAGGAVIESATIG
jgi:HK97 family phage prohead protease